MSDEAEVISRIVAIAGSAALLFCGLIVSPEDIDNVMNLTIGFAGTIGTSVVKKNTSQHYHTLHTLTIIRTDIKWRRDIYTIEVCNSGEDIEFSYKVRLGLD